MPKESSLSDGAYYVGHFKISFSTDIMISFRLFFDNRLATVRRHTNNTEKNKRQQLFTMGGMAGAILILLMVAAGAYCYWKTSNDTKGEKDDRTWKEKYLPWGSGGGGGEKTVDDNEKDEFHDEETGDSKSATNAPKQPAKSWGDAFYDKVMELPSPGDLKMMMFKKSMSQSL